MFLYLAMIDSDADKSKFEILYSEYKNLMYYTANRILRNSSDAEDVVHQAFLKVIEILDTISSPWCRKSRPVPRKAAPQCPAACRGIYRSRADPLVQTAERLVRENPAGWQGTASELTGWVKEFTGVSYTAQSLSHQMRNLRDAFSKYDDIIYQPASLQATPATAAVCMHSIKNLLYVSV